MKKSVIIFISLLSIVLAQEEGVPQPYVEEFEGVKDVKPVESQFPGMMPGMGGMMPPMMGGMGGMMPPMMGGMGGMGAQQMNSCPCGAPPSCPPCMPWTPCMPCSCPCSSPTTTQNPNTPPVEDTPKCDNGAPHEFFPDCCFNGGRGKFCCTNGANNLHCCLNGANNPQCQLPTQPPVRDTTPTPPSNGPGGCQPCQPCQPCMIWWMCSPCNCNNGCTTTAPETTTEVATTVDSVFNNCPCICAPCQPWQPCNPCPSICPFDSTRHLMGRNRVCIERNPGSLF